MRKICMTVEFLPEKSEIMAAALICGLPAANVRRLMDGSGMKSALDALDAAEQAVREARDQVDKAKKSLAAMVRRDWKDSEISDALKELMK